MEPTFQKSKQCKEDSKGQINKVSSRASHTNLGDLGQKEGTAGEEI